MVVKDKNSAVEEAMRFFEEHFGPAPQQRPTQSDFGRSSMEFVKGPPGAFEKLHIEALDDESKLVFAFGRPLVKCTREGERAFYELQLVRTLLLEDGRLVFHLCN